MIVETGSPVVPLCLQIIRINCPFAIYKEVDAFSFLSKNKNIVLWFEDKTKDKSGRRKRMLPYRQTAGYCKRHTISTVGVTLNDVQKFVPFLYPRSEKNSHSSHYDIENYQIYFH
jgi:hypothetical protein